MEVPQKTISSGKEAHDTLVLRETENPFGKSKIDFYTELHSENVSSAKGSRALQKEEKRRVVKESAYIDFPVGIVNEIQELFCNNRIYELKSHDFLSLYRPFYSTIRPSS